MSENYINPGNIQNKEKIEIKIKIPKILNTILETFSKSSDRDKDTFITECLAQEVRGIYELPESLDKYHFKKPFIKKIESFIGQYFD